MSDIFISYAREDRDKAKALAELFQHQDWSVWWDRNIPPGRSFDEVIEEALGAAKCVVVLWSKNSASSDWVKGEAAEGLRRKILVPVRIDSANVPLEFRRLETVDLSDWKGEAGHLELGGFLEAVAANIKGVVQRPPSEGSQRKLMKPVLTVLAIVALLAAGFAFYKFAGDRARLGSRASAGGSPAPQPPQTLTPTPVAAQSSPIATPQSSPTTQTELAVDLSTYLLYAELFHERYQKGWANDPEDLAAIGDEINGAVTTLRKKEYVYRAWVRKYWGSPAVEQFAQVMAAVKSVDDAVHAFNDAGNKKEKTNELGKRLDKLRAQVDQLLSQPGAQGKRFPSPRCASTIQIVRASESIAET